MDGDPASYIRLVEARLERAIDHDAVRAVYGGMLDAPAILKLNPSADVKAMLKSARQMGLPMRKTPKRAGLTATPDVKALATSIPPPAEHFTVELHGNKVRLIFRDRTIASCEEGGAELYAALFRDVKARIESLRR